MTYLLIILFSISLLYFALAERMKMFVYLLSFQGFILFGLVFFNLQNISLADFLFILTETIIVKAVVIPWFLNWVRKRNQLKRVHEPYVPVFYSILFTMLIIIVSLLITNNLLTSGLARGFLAIAMATVLFGIYFIVVHRNIFSHVVGYLIVENGIFLLSLAVGSEMPAMVNLAILLDLIMGILVLGIFINRIGDRFHSIETESLTSLKD